MYIVVIVGLLLDFAHYQALIDQGMLEAEGTLRDAYAEQCFAPTDLSYLEVLRNRVMLASKIKRHVATTQ